jgi:hypothetical protein
MRALGCSYDNPGSGRVGKRAGWNCSALSNWIFHSSRLYERWFPTLDSAPYKSDFAFEGAP